MKNKKIFVLLGVLVIIVISFFAGLFIGQANYVKNDLWIINNDQTFYATIEKFIEYNGNQTILVKGLEVNDINYRGEFTLSIKDNTIMTWRGTSINISDLNVGSNISITFSDETLNAISPTPIREVVRIQLLDDEI